MAFVSTIRKCDKVLSPWVSIRESTVVDERGGEELYHSLVCNDYVCVLPFVSDNELLMVRQYRPAIGETTIEFPAGILEEGELAIDCARRELVEETGYRAQQIEHFYSGFVDTGRMANKIHAFAASCLDEPSTNTVVEAIEPIKVPANQVMSLLSGCHSLSLHVGLYCMFMMRGKSASSS